MKNIISYLRIKEWLSSKVTMMLGIFVYFSYIGKWDGETTIIGLITFFYLSQCF